MHISLVKRRQPTKTYVNKKATPPVEKPAIDKIACISQTPSSSRAP
jgi:hypothetical protein